jgi:hypothetical protein
MSTDRSIQGADPVQNADLSPDELDAVAGGGGITVSKTTDSTSPNLFQQSVTNNPIQETDFHLNIPLIEP